ncbi:molybdate ABC transporter permease subunit [Sessilibacter corallicola]|uniref:Molybdenum transport system permease n=1 Tax=Sessilibacter corallicola TaxID=2904075 RepID=A0ABQ0AEX9_9GAMM
MLLDFLTTLDTTPIVLSLKLAVITTVLLLIITTPLAWWLTGSSRRTKSIATAVATLPLVLPPSVLGFYLLLLLGTDGPLGQLSQLLGFTSLAFTFQGLVIASIIYSFPFALQPIQNAFESMGRKPIEAAATLGASPWDRFFTVALPIARPGILTAAVLSFAHTIGEFGVILMIGGNIPGETKVLSIAIYDHVESIEYDQAHALSLLMIVFSFVVLFLLYFLNSKSPLATARTPAHHD